MSVNELKGGDVFLGFLVATDISIKETTAGKPYLSAVLSDKSGSIATVWWDYDGSITSDMNGSIVKVKGNISTYRDKLQLVVSKIRGATDSDVFDKSDLVKTAPIDFEAELKYITGIIDTIADADYKNIATVMLNKHMESFKVMPAALKVHHGFIHGLLMHTANMMKLAEATCNIYPKTIMNRDLLLTGVLIHDLNKDAEFARNSLGIVTEYTNEGNLLGHLLLGVLDIERTAESLGIPHEKTLLLEHLVASHHGNPEWGAIVRPLTAEAEALHCIDYMDSHLEAFSEQLQQMPANTFSEPIRSLDNRRIFNHD